MTLTEITFALLVLLAAPGPTNALLAMAGAQGNRGMALPFLVLAGYAGMVLPLAIWGGKWLESLPELRMGLTLCAGLWVGLLALRLWRMDDFSLSAPITPLQIGLTTLLNPKGLVIGLVLLPKAAVLPVGIMVFSGLVLAISTLWLQLGAGLPLTARPLVNRGGALWLGVLAAVILGRALTA